MMGETASPTGPDVPRLQQALAAARAHLLSQRLPEGYWEGHLSSSALATATALSALALADDPADANLVRGGVAWLQETQNADGGWGDSPDSRSNLATTLLVTAALKLVGEAVVPASLRDARWLAAHGATDGASIVAAVRRAYGRDRTFAVPILMNCALAGLVDWRDVPHLPFQLAALPRSWYRWLRLQVVSYALPALIAVGLTIERHRPVRSAGSVLRRVLAKPVLAKLAGLQPDSGGFLEATPLTSFVCMSLLSLGLKTHPVVAAGLRFIRQSARGDGAWPIDTNLSVWVTSLAYGALAGTGGFAAAEAERTRAWLAARQGRVRHPFTDAAPGGWGWSHLSGAVPDADDTSGALLALYDSLDEASRAAGVRWLLDLQNTDGGWPTFCRGWGQLPFDQSCDDITAHALRALSVGVPASSRHAVGRGLAYLRRRQRADGSWVPLWFGNETTPEQDNPVLGTARVLTALADLAPAGELATRGREFLLQSQNEDGGWGGARGVVSTLEETALAVTALSQWPEASRDAIRRGAAFLADRIERGDWSASPIGLYFARLWYAERLYPVVWTVEALGQAIRALSSLEA